MSKIYTITLSPALDAEYTVPALEVGETCRASGFSLRAGGKGINVTRAMKNVLSPEMFSSSVITAAPLGGEVGKIIRSLLGKENIPIYFFEIDSQTRMNISLIDESAVSEPTEVNSAGTPISAALDGIEKFILSSAIEDDIVALCGSLPSDVPADYPVHLSRILTERGIKLVLDISGEPLRLAMESDCPPDLIKPNRREAESLIGRKIEDAEDAKLAAAEIYEKSSGKTSVILTLGGKGFVWADRPEAAYYPAIPKKVKVLKGAGDSFLGVYLAERYLNRQPPTTSLLRAQKYAEEYVGG